MKIIHLPPPELSPDSFSIRAIRKGNNVAYVIYIDKCKACGTCMEECPVLAINKEGDIYVIDPEICTDCGYCSDICPEEAILGY